MTAKEQITKEIGKNAALQATMASEGGRLIMSNLKKDILSSMDEISTKYKTASHVELIAAAAKMSERLAIYRALNGSVKRKKIAEQDLIEFLKDNPEEE